MRAAIELSDWFGGEARRVYGTFVEDPASREQRELIELIKRKGGRLTARELQQGSRRFNRAIDAEIALDGLVRAGQGHWELIATATKQRREFILSTPSTYTDSPNSRDSSENVYVDTVDVSQTKGAP